MSEPRDPLDALASEADSLANPPEPGAPGGQVAPAPPPEPGNFEALAFLLAGFREVACLVLKVQSLKRTLGDPNVEACARVLAPVADKYGLKLGDMLGGPEAAAVMMAGPILWGAWRELDAELRARRARPAAEPAGEPAAAPGQGGPNG